MPSTALQGLRDFSLDGIPFEELDLSLVHLLDAALELDIPGFLDSRLRYVAEARDQLGGKASAFFPGQLESELQEGLGRDAHAFILRPFSAAPLLDRRRVTHAYAVAGTSSLRLRQREGSQPYLLCTRSVLMPRLIPPMTDLRSHSTAEQRMLVCDQFNHTKG